MTQPRNRDRNQPGHPTEFTHKDQTAPGITLEAPYTHHAGTPVTDPVGTIINIDGDEFTIGPATDAFAWPLDQYDYSVVRYELTTTDDESQQARNSAGRTIDLTPVYEYLAREYGTEIDESDRMAAEYESAIVESVVMEQSLSNGEIAILHTDQGSVAVPYNLALKFEDLDAAAPTEKVPLSDGRTVNVPEGLRDRFRGLDGDGHIVVASDVLDKITGIEYLYPLTPCCNATGKGDGEVESGVVCRACYEEVDPKFAGGHMGQLTDPA